MKFKFNCLLIIATLLIMVFCNGCIHKCKEYEWIEKIQATCVQDGREIERCKECQKETGNYIVNEKFGHTEGEWRIEEDASCEKTGIKYKKCLRCDEKIKESTIDKLEHVISDWIIEEEMTCTKDGKKYKECINCKKRIEEDIIKAKHIEEKINGKEPTCTETGLTDGVKCAVCNDILVKQKEIKALGHEEITIPAVSPTCSSFGLTEGSKCSRCDEVLVKQENVNKLSHNYVTDEKVEPTCSSFGLTEGSHCLNCNQVKVKQETIDKLPHSFNFLTNRCSDCNEKEYYQEVTSIEELEEDVYDKTKELVVYFSLFKWPSNTYTVSFNSEYKYIKIIGDPNAVYNARIKVSPNSNLTLDFVNVNLKPEKNVSPIVINSTAKVVLGLYGQSCSFTAIKPEPSVSYIGGGADGDDGKIALDATTADLTINFATSRISKLIGGSGANGQDETLAGNGGNGNYAIFAKSITIVTEKGYDVNNLSIIGGTGGKGGSGWSDGDDGKNSPATNVTIEYK